MALRPVFFVSNSIEVGDRGPADGVSGLYDFSIPGHDDHVKVGPGAGFFELKASELVVYTYTYDDGKEHDLGIWLHTQRQKSPARRTRA